MIDADIVARTVEFHGHMCPGLAIGLRVAELALNEFGRHSPRNELLAVVETDMCPVDAIQLLTGCTFGRGNLIHLDYGKNAFSFIRVADGHARRISVRRAGWGAPGDDPQSLSQAILTQPLDTLLAMHTVEPAVLPRARPLHQLTCAGCGEIVLETHSRRFAGQTYCQPCFTRCERGQNKEE
jgi:formylmethanofuran dehydrogenase subunit E